MWRRWAVPLGLGAAVVAAIAVRIPSFLSDRHIAFDEGVYSASVLAMRSGAQPFRDVFSSQGPLFLPLLWVFDVAGLRHFRALRLGMMLTAVALTVGVYLLARRAAGEGGALPALLAAFVVGTATAGIAAAGPVQSDGPALAFALWALVAVTWPGTPGRWRPLVVGLLLGAGVALKSLFLAPAALAVALFYARRKEWGPLVIATSVAWLVLVALALPWGLSSVWDQSVSLHLDVPRDRSWWGNISANVPRLWRRDRVFAAAAVIGLVVVIARLVLRRRPPGDRAVLEVVAAWLALSILLLVFGVEVDRGSYRFLAFLIAPVMVAFAALRPPRIAMAIAVLLTVAVLPGQLQRSDRFLGSQQPTEKEREIVTLLEALPAGALVVADEPGLAWMAGRHPPPSLVDTSFARIFSGSLQPDDVRAGAARDDVCAVLFYSGRFRSLDRTLGPGLTGYRLAAEWDDDDRLYVKDTCR